MQFKEYLKSHKKKGDRVIVKRKDKKIWGTVIKDFLGKWKLKLDNGETLNYDPQLIVANYEETSNLI